MMSQDTALRDALSKQVVEHFCRVLNQALEIDRVAISALFQERRPCSQALEEVVVVDPTKPKTFSALGLLNGLVYSTGWRIQSVVDDKDPDGPIIQFRPWYYPPEGEG